MLKRVFFLIVFIGLIAWLLYKASFDQTGVEFTLLGHVFETSLYFLGAIFLVIFKVLHYIFNVFNVTKFLISSVFGFFTGKSKERAEKALLNAYAAALSGRPVQARKYLKKCEKFYADNPHPAFIKLITDKAIGDKEIAADAMLKLEKASDHKTLTPYVKSLYEEDQTNKLQYIQDAGAYKENMSDLEKYISLSLQNNAYDDVQKILKNGKSLLDDPKKHLTALHIIQSHSKALEQNPEASLSHAQSAMKEDNNVIAFLLAQNAFKKLLRENKSSRLIHDRFRAKPDYTTIKAFLDIRVHEEEEKMAKRISALPRDNEKEDAFLALQAYHFAKYRDFQSLAVAVRYVEDQEQNDWSSIALLCLAMERDEVFYEQALILFLDMIHAKAYQELYDAVQTLPEIYHSYLLSVIAPYQEKSLDIVRHQMSLFQDMIKHIPLDGQYKGSYGAASKISQDDVKQLYNGSFKDDDEEEDI